MPPSTYATGTPSLRATMAQAMVEVTSLTTRQSAFLLSINTFSYHIMMFAVCSTCVPEPTSKLMTGSGMPSCSKKSPDMAPS